MSIFGHQGDVFFRPSSLDNLELGEEMKVEDNGGITLVEGELTGHHHQFREPSKVKIFPIKQKDTDNVIQLFAVKVLEPTTLDHYNVITKQLTKEHNSITFPAGNYIVGNQRQMSIDLQIQRAVD